MKDNCVICSKETEWEEQEVIHNRRCYVEGVGQLCNHCYIDTHLHETPEDIAGQALSEMQRYDVFKNPWDED
jgi:hypothetical protein